MFYPKNLLNKPVYIIAMILIQINLINRDCFAQSSSRFETPSVKSQVAKILLSSLGGAVLGVSTLSFYDRPQDHLSNVAIGGVLGVVLGSIYVTRDSLEQDLVSTIDKGGTWSLSYLPEFNNRSTKYQEKGEKVALFWACSF